MLRIVLSLLLSCAVSMEEAGVGWAASPPGGPWQQLIQEAHRLDLPTEFLKEIPPDFVTIEFEDLHTYAAEYHPDGHRMVLNRTLSFNAAGAVLRPLRTLNTRDVGTLFHELFHAYMDFLVAETDGKARGGQGDTILRVARNRQACRYTQVEITPVVQRKAATEGRELSERESWEALNETWGVFIGWAVWTKLEALAGPQGAGKREAAVRRDWFSRLQRAERRGELRGYYEPEDSDERALTKKRFLAQRYRIAPDEAQLLLESVMELPASAAASAAKMIALQAAPLDLGRGCETYPVDFSINTRK